MCASYKQAVSKDITLSLKQLKKYLFNKKVYSNLILFGISKGSVFITPLLAASVLSNANYGLLEWALSLSMITGVVLTLGAGGVLSFEIVKNQKSSLISTALSYVVIITLVLGTLGILSLALNLSNQISYVVGFVGLFVGQFALSAYLKANGRGAFASVIESFVYVVILFLVFISYANQISYFKHLILFPLSALVFSSILFYFGGNKIDLDGEKVAIFLQRGLPIMVSSLFAMGFVNMPRVLLGSFESFEQLAVFSIDFRWAAIAFIVYQFTIVINFRKIYTYSYEKLDVYITIVSWGVLFLGFIILLCLVVLEKYGLVFGSVFPKVDLLVQGFMAGIITLWSLSSSLEGLFFRENLTKWQIYATVIGIGVFLGSLLVFSNILQNVVLAFVVSWFFAYAIIIFSQLFFLKKNIAQASLMYLKFSVSLISFMGVLWIVFGELL